MSNHILIASPVSKDARILREFLASLETLSHGESRVSYCFYDDNDDADASVMLRAFAEEHGAALLDIAAGKNLPDELGDHQWSMRKIERITHIKNEMIRYFLRGEYTHLFFIDSDLVLQRDTLDTLLGCNKDIVANIFWTAWQEGSRLMPQVWLKDAYTLYDAHQMFPKSAEQQIIETLAFLGLLREAGTYRVGGLGACTLISRRVLEAGVNFNPIYNLSFWGEDRSFCVRAVAYGFELFVNTEHPAFHIYRLSDLDDLPEWKRRQK